MPDCPIVPGESYGVLRTARGNFIIGPVKLIEEHILDSQGNGAVQVKVTQRCGYARSVEIHEKESDRER